MGGILGVGISGLKAYQSSLDTVSHNITNANTEGYSRQVTELQTRTPQFQGVGFVGQGVQAGATNRIVDNFLNTIIRTNVANNASYEMYLNYAESIDGIVADPSTGISVALQDFFGSLQEASNNPGSIPTRQALLSQTEILESRFQSLDYQIKSQASDLNESLGEIVKQVNTLSSNISQLNSDIVDAKGLAGGASPNDLLDQRDVLLKQLSQLINISISEQEDGAVNVFAGNGISLVIGSISSTLSTSPDPNDASRVEINLDGKNSKQVITGNVAGGELGGLLHVLDEVILPAQNALGRLAVTLASTFNEQHHKGMDLNNNLGKDLFLDVNSNKATLSRISARSSNKGSALIKVDVDPIARSTNDPAMVFSSVSALQNVGTLASLNITGDLKLNGINIRATSALDDTVSPSGDSSASAIAIAKAINETSTQHGVTAKALTNNLSLGTFTPGAITAGEFKINGIDVVSSGTNLTTLLHDINSITTQTGVKASADVYGNVILSAFDGRNIELRSNTNTPTATFQNFDLSSGTAFSQVVRANVTLSHDSSIAIDGFNPNNIGFTKSTTPLPHGSLTLSDYELYYDGSNYRLTRLSDKLVVATDSDVNNISVDGFSLKLESGVIKTGDLYNIKPTKTGAENFVLQITDPLEFALGLPVNVEDNLNNKGNGVITLDDITNTTGSPVATDGVLGNAFEQDYVLSPPMEIEFISDTVYRVYDVSSNVNRVQIGPDRTFVANSKNDIFPIEGVIDTSGATPNATYIYSPGFKVSISGTAKKGDKFTISYNTDASGDNRNAVEFTKLQNEPLMINKSATLQDSYAQMVSEVGSKTARAKTNLIASTSLLKQSEARREAISGVNLDEEAANLMRMQQAYQAAAQVVTIAREMFDSLMLAFRG